MTIFKHGWSVKPMRFMLVNIIRWIGRRSPRNSKTWALPKSAN